MTLSDVTMWHQQNMDRTGLDWIGSDQIVHFGLWLLRDVAFGFRFFVKNSNGISKFLLVCLQSEWQLNASTNLKQPPNTNVIERNA